MPAPIPYFAFYDAANKLQRVEIAASPVPGSKLHIEHEFTESLKLRIEQAPNAPKEYWKPNEICLEGVDAIRALRDACTRFLDRFHDEQEIG